MQNYATIQTQTGPEGITTITFNRPQAHNTRSLEMVDEIRTAMVACAGDMCPLIFTGAGSKAFVSGADIAELKDRRRPEAMQRINAALFRDIEQLPAGCWLRWTLTYRCLWR